MKKQYLTLVKREFWESRSLWVAPAIAAGLLLVLWVFGCIMAAMHMRDIGSINFSGINLNVPMGGGRPVAPRISMGLWGLASQVYMVSSLACGFYLLDCLYSERKDRSILFWKSLPVSDRDTVLSKILVALVIVPLGVFVLASVLFVACYAIAAAIAPDFSTVTGGWHTLEWLQSEVGLLFASIVTMLWYAPLAAWSMLASVVSRRSPIMLATMPVVVLAVCENILLRSAHVWKFAALRMVPVVNPVEALQRPGLWIGLAVAAGMLYMVIRLRRYRDDT